MLVKNHDSVPRVSWTLPVVSHQLVTSAQTCTNVLFSLHFLADEKLHSAPPLTNNIITTVPKSGSTEARLFFSPLCTFCCCFFLFFFGNWDSLVITATEENCGCSRCCWQPPSTTAERRLTVGYIQYKAVDAAATDKPEKGTCTQSQWFNSPKQMQGERARQLPYTRHCRLRYLVCFYNSLHVTYFDLFTVRNSCVETGSDRSPGLIVFCVR